MVPGHGEPGFMSGQFHTAQFRSGCVRPGCVPPRCVESIFRSSAGGAAPDADPRTGARDQRPPDTHPPAQLGGRMHPSPASHHGAEQGSTPVRRSTTPFRQHRRGAAWWYGPGPALPRGPSDDDLKVDATVSMYGVNVRWIVAGQRTAASTPSPDCRLMNVSSGLSAIQPQDCPTLSHGIAAIGAWTGDTKQEKTGSTAKNACGEPPLLQLL